MLIKKTFAFALISVATLTACTPQAPTTTPLPPETPPTSQNTTVTETTETTETTSPIYENFSQTRYNQLKGNKPFAIFFHADWCPTCRKMEKDITEDLASFPQGTIILEANFDTEEQLKNTYKITSQSTIVIINANGQPTETLAAPSNKKLKESLQASLI